MTQPRFTPGPWSVVKHDRFPFEREVKAEDGYICSMEGLSDDDMPTIEANANLIAAAPEMYKALMLVAEAFVLYQEDRGPLGQIVRVALAKADGKESQ